MRQVLLTTHPNAYLHQGGGEREILLLREALAESEVIADIYGPTSKAVAIYDFAIHFSMVGGSEHIVQALAEAGTRLILWPNLWFVNSPPTEHITNLTRFLSYFEAVVFRSHAEEAHFRRFFDLAGKAVIHAACLVSPRFQRKDVTDVFRESYGLDHYAIWTGIIEPQKNQLAAVQAFKGLDIDLIISGRVRDETYAERCREEAGPNVHFIPPMSFGSELHLSALRFSSLFVELPLDFPGTSAVEAATAGCRMLLSRSDWTGEVLGKYCVQTEAQDIREIRAAIQSMLESPKNSSRLFKGPNMPTAVGRLLAYLNS